MAEAFFPKETASFLADLAENNNREWFEANRARYEASYVSPALAFIETLGPRLKKIAPGVRYEPKINGSLARINRDTRFSSDKTPYKTHLDLWFWHGDKRGWNQPGFYMRITPKEVFLGAGMHGFEKDLLEAYRRAVLDERAGKALAKIATAVAAARPYEVGGKTRKTVPRGLDAAHPRAEFLKHEGLYAGLELPFSAATKKDFADVAAGHFAAVWPIGKWIAAEVTQPAGSR